MRKSGEDGNIEKTSVEKGEFPKDCLRFLPVNCSTALGHTRGRTWNEVSSRSEAKW